MSSTSRTVRLFGVARGVKGGATKYDKAPSEYNAKMKLLSASIFGELKRPMETKNDKKLVYSLTGRPLQDRSWIVKYYPAHEETGELLKDLRAHGLYRDEHQDFVEEMERMRKLRGKGRFDWYKKWYKPKDGK